MILPMAKVRLLGRREDLPETLRVLQDLGTLHVTDLAIESELLEPAALLPTQLREIRYVRRALEDIERILSYFGATEVIEGAIEIADRADVARWARRVRRLRRKLDALEDVRMSLVEERELIQKYRDFFAAFQSLLAPEISATPGTTAHCLVLKGADEAVLEKLRGSIGDVAGDDFEMRVKTLDSGEAAILLTLPSSGSESIEGVFSRAGVQEVPVPPSYGGQSPAQAIPRMMSRLDEIPAELEELASELALMRDAHGRDVRGARAALHDRCRLLETLPVARLTPHAFVIDGWVPEGAREALERRLASEFDEKFAVEPLAEASWPNGSAPIALENPRIFRPFEVLVRFVPLPRYGTIDPTPYVAVFFPMFFGVMLGDVGHGALLGILAWILHRRARPGSALSSLARVAFACAAFSVLFGFLFGELFGDLGRKTIGLPALWFRREDSLLPFLGLALALGFVHILLGLLLGALAALRGRRREALGRGVAAVMIVLILTAILAAVEVLPRAFFSPAVVALLVAFPILVIAEGLLAPFELLAAISNIFSYARIMAIGTASVMMAIVANRMVGAIGSVVVGVLFALLFHLVNFALGVFAPTIHALRLHYVEFFGKFYRPGGAQYQPLRHWQPDASPTRK